MIKIPKILKCKKGMTLVELIVGVMIFTVITTIASAVLAQMVRVYSQSNELAELNTLLDNVANHIVSDISNATTPLVNIGIDNEITVVIDTNTITYTVAGDGTLLRSAGGAAPIPILPKTFYKNKSVGFVLNLSPSGTGTAYMLTVTIHSDHNGSPIISRDYAIRPLALNQY